MLYTSIQIINPCSPEVDIEVAATGVAPGAGVVPDDAAG